MLGALDPPVRVLVAGRLDGCGGLHVIDTQDLASLRERLTFHKDALGEFTVDEWWATTELAQVAGR